MLNRIQVTHLRAMRAFGEFSTAAAGAGCASSAANGTAAICSEARAAAASCFAAWTAQLGACGFSGALLSIEMQGACSEKM